MAFAYSSLSPSKPHKFWNGFCHLTYVISKKSFTITSNNIISKITNKFPYIFAAYLETIFRPPSPKLVTFIRDCKRYLNRFCRDTSLSNPKMCVSVSEKTIELTEEDDFLYNFSNPFFFIQSGIFTGVILLLMKRKGLEKLQRKLSSSVCFPCKVRTCHNHRTTIPHFKKKSLVKYSKITLEEYFRQFSLENIIIFLPNLVLGKISFNNIIIKTTQSLNHDQCDVEKAFDKVPHTEIICKLLQFYCSRHYVF